MIYITRAATGKRHFRAVHVADNNEPLNVTESLPTKRLVWRNIYASVADHGPAARMTVQDDTVKRGPLVYVVRLNPNSGKIERAEANTKPKPRYEPGKNARKLFR